jgi:predicted RNase H-like nuclease (RuvC/YqgF family)
MANVFIDPEEKNSEETFENTFGVGGESSFEMKPGAGTTPYSPEGHPDRRESIRSMKNEIEDIHSLVESYTERHNAIQHELLELFKAEEGLVSKLEDVLSKMKASTDIVPDGSEMQENTLLLTEQVLVLKNQLFEAENRAKEANDRLDMYEHLIDGLVRQYDMLERSTLDHS